MDDKGILRKLQEAAGKDKGSISSDNLFRDIGFDGDNPRLGWFVLPEFSQIEDALKLFSDKASGKNEFIFVGMGGSANGIKTVIQLTNSDSIYVLDSLDPEAIDAVLAQVKDFKRVLVCPISKSGTTKETQLIANTLKDALGDNWPDNFLWIADKSAFTKLDNSGWQQAEKIPIQADHREDIGGRFTCPHTLIFLAPLYIALGRDLERLQDFWNGYLSVAEKFRENALSLAYGNIQSSGNFKIVVPEQICTGITNWVIQLFQESLGSKAEGFYPKTLVSSSSKAGKFDIINIKAKTQDKLVYTAGLMYSLQVFVAAVAYLKNINFVNQPYVEIYKKELKNPGDIQASQPKPVDFNAMLDDITNSASPDQRFIDIILYFNPSDVFKRKIKDTLSGRFTDKYISIFEGSDWNHHSYQAAFKDIKTLFVIVVLTRYKSESEYVKDELIRQDSETLKDISRATYKTLQDKALYFSFSP